MSSSAPAAAWDAEAFRALGHAVVDRLADHLAACARGEVSVVDWKKPDDLRELWAARFAPRGSNDALAVVERVLANAVRQHHPRYLGHQVSAPLPVAALLGLVGAIVNNGMAAYESGPASSAAEKSVIEFLGARFGFDAAADGVLTSGGTLGNLTALAAARRARGASEALCVLTSGDAHYSIGRAAQLMGWGKAGVVPVLLDRRRRMRTDALAAAFDAARAAGKTVVGVVANAGSTPVGAYDPLPEIAEFCREHALWLHVDGAHGASAVFSREHRALVSGIEQADSLTWDAHKLMALPALVTAVLFRDGSRSYDVFSQDAPYLYAPGARRWYDIGLRTVECTKRMMSIELFGSLEVLGTDFFDGYVTGRYALARRFAEHLAQQTDFSLALSPESNIVAFRHLPSGASAEAGLQDAIRNALIADGSFFLSRTDLDGEPHLRAVLMNPHTSFDDLLALLDAIRVAARRLAH